MPPGGALLLSAVLLALAAPAAPAAASAPVALALFDWDVGFGSLPWPASGVDTVMALLAVRHFNQRRADIVPALGNLSGCARYLNITSFCDTRGMPSRAFGALLQITRSPLDAVIGPVRSVEAETLGIGFSVLNIPMVSPYATSPDLAANHNLYPYFARTVFSDSAPASFLVRTLRHLGYQHMTFIGDNSPFGTGWSQALVAAAQVYQMTLLTAQYSTLSTNVNDTTSFASALARLAQSKINVLLILTTGDAQLPVIAQAINITRFFSPDDLLIIWPSLTSLESISGLTNGSDANAYIASIAHGSLMLEVGIPQDNPLWVSFKQKWSDFDSEVPWLNSILPNGTGSASAQNCLADDSNLSLPWNFFASTPSSLLSDPAAIYYDAVLAVGLAECAAAPHGPKPSGSALYNAMVGSTFTGLSGRVVFDAATGDRDPLSATYTFVNIVRQANGSIFNRVVGVYDALKQSDFTLNTSLVTFRSGYGAAHQPLDITPPPQNFNYLPEWCRIVCYILLSLLSLVVVGCLAFVIVYRANRVVNRAQPEALGITAVGCLIMTWSIIGLSVDDNPNPRVGTGMDPNAACMVTPVLFAFGFALAIAGLLAKSWRIYVLFNNTKLERFTVSAAKMVGVVCLLAMVDLAILIAWIVVAPLTFQRVVDVTDQYGFPLSSHGLCGGGEVSGSFVIAVFLLHGVAMACCMVVSHIVRDLPTEFHEGKYLQVALMSMGLVYVVAVPAIIAVYNSVVGRFVVELAVIVVTVVCVVCAMFLPKMLMVWYPGWIEPSSGPQQGMQGPLTGGAGRSSMVNLNGGGPVPGTSERVRRRSLAASSAAGMNQPLPPAAPTGSSAAAGTPWLTGVGVRARSSDASPSGAAVMTDGGGGGERGGTSPSPETTSSKALVMV